MKNRAAEVNFMDLEIRIFPRQDAGYPVEITLGGQQVFPTGYLAAAIVPWVPSKDGPAADGRRLFEALFADSALRRAWDVARGRAPQRRIRLRIDPPAAELHRLPWELMQEHLVTLSAQADTPFSRCLPVELPWGEPIEERPVRVLVAISNPDDLATKCGLEPVDVVVEQELLKSAFAAAGPYELVADFLDPPVTLKRLEERLRDGYHALHFVGHGVFHSGSGQAWLYMQDEEGHACRALDEALVGMLARQGVQPRLVFLAACQSATRSMADAFLGLGPRLVAVGVPAVVAMQDAVTVETARQFSATFHQRLLEHGLVDLAANEARSTLLTAGRPDAEVPVLFMRLTSGRLWGGEGESRVEAEAEVLPPPEPTPPPEMTGFVGRRAELATFAERLATSRLAIIVGMPGVGKTALTAVLARRVAGPDKVFWHSLHREEGVQEIIWKLAGFLYWRGQRDLWCTLQRTRMAGGQPPPARELLDYVAQMIRGQGFLLCLDDLQFLSDDDAPLLGQFIQRLLTEETSFIIASRRMPAFVGKVEFEALEGLNAEDARSLLAQRGLSLPDDLIADLYDRTRGNAQFLLLAIDALQRAQDPSGLITRLSETDKVEHYLMTQVDRRLAGDERAVMSAVALLDYPGTRDAIEAVLDRSGLQRTLNDLRHRCLLTVIPGEAGREYGQHAIVRDFYYGLLGRHERREMHRRAGAYYETEEPDALKAARHFQRAGEYERAAGLVTANAWALVNRGRSRALLLVLERFTAQQLDTAHWAEVNIARGQVYTLLGEGQAARRSYREALSQLAALPDSPTVRELRARTCRGMGELLQHASPPEALDWLRRGLDELAGASDLEEAALHIRAGTVQVYTGDFAAALDAIRKGLALLPEAPSQLRAVALINLGIIHCVQGDIEQGRGCYLRALEISQELLDHWRIVDIRLDLGIEKEIAGQWEGASAEYREALDLAERLGSVRQQAALELALGIVNMKRGNDGLAEVHLSNCLAIARDHNLREQIVGGQSSLADLHLRRGKPEAAEPLLVEVEQMALDMGAKSQLPEIYRLQAQVRLAAGQPRVAREYAGRSVNLARDLDLKPEEGMSLRVLGQALVAAGERGPAIDIFRQSLSILADLDPYEAARTKVQWGLALVAGGDVRRGTALLEEANVALYALGACKDELSTQASLAQRRRDS